MGWVANGEAVRNNCTAALSCCAALRRASRSVTLLYDLVLAPTGLRATQFIVLHIVYDAGQIAQCDFARNHSVAIETLSRSLGGLRRKGYLQVQVGPRHGERVYSLTDAGEDAFLQALPHWQRAQDRLQSALAHEDWDALLAFCDRVSQAAKNAERLRKANQATIAD